MSEKPKDHSKDKATIIMSATVEKIIPPFAPNEPEKAQIALHDAEHLYREIRVENTLQDGDGKPVKLKKGAEVEVTIEAPAAATVPTSKKNN